MVRDLKNNDSKNVTVLENTQSLKLTDQPSLDIKENGKMIESNKILCLEEHHNIKYSFFSKNTEACKWGKKHNDVETCGDCPYSSILLEFTPTNKKYIESWESRLKNWGWPKKYSHLYHPHSKVINKK
jgi:hypothetical protein